MILLAGLMAGFVLGGFLYVFQQWTDIPVYTLLMNVDYFPVLGSMYLPDWIEFSLHLLVSTVVVWILYFLLKKKRLEQKLIPYLFYSSIIGLIIFPTTVLSVRTPEIDNIWAWVIWMSGHIVYGFSVWGMLRLGKSLKVSV